jgi:hypothetical protein
VVDEGKPHDDEPIGTLQQALPVVCGGGCKTGGVSAWTDVSTYSGLSLTAWHICWGCIEGVAGPQRWRRKDPLKAPATIIIAHLPLNAPLHSKPLISEPYYPHHQHRHLLAKERRRLLTEERPGVFAACLGCGLAGSST